MSKKITLTYIYQSLKRKHIFRQGYQNKPLFQALFKSWVNAIGYAYKNKSRAIYKIKIKSANRMLLHCRHGNRLRAWYDTQYLKLAVYYALINGRTFSAPQDDRHYIPPNKSIASYKKPNITFASCWYYPRTQNKPKYPKKIYHEWISNLLSYVNTFNIVIYTDVENSKYLEQYANNNDKIKIIIKDYESFNVYRHKNAFIKNYQSRNLNWAVNMIWCEKTSCVVDAMHHFDTPYYGWCDIGCFREITAKNWPHPQRIESLNDDRIHIIFVKHILEQYQILIDNKNAQGLPDLPIPSIQNVISCSAFCGNKKSLLKCHQLFIETLQRYFANNYYIQDDQMIMLDCALNNRSNFNLIKGRWFELQESYLK